MAPQTEFPQNEFPQTQSDNGEDIVVLSFGGSIIVPDEVDHRLLSTFRRVVLDYLQENPKRRLIMVTGGGAPARNYQEAFRKVAETFGGEFCGSPEEQDWIGIEATKLNARLVKGVFYDLCHDPVVHDPETAFAFTGRILIASGWKPGFSTDYVAVTLAGRFKNPRVVNLSNIAYIYSGDPKLDPSAEPLERMTWPEVRRLVGDTWVPGKNVPFDPIAAQLAEKLDMEVVVAAGRDLENLSRILRDRPFKGTLITPA